jgi:hypothetical protein
MIELKHMPLTVARKSKRGLVKWADRNGWQPYDGNDRWINLKQGRRLVSIETLYLIYKETL